MTFKRIAAVLLLGIFCNACSSGATHSSVGVIKGFGEARKTVIIQHQAFPDGFMEAMTMTFELDDPGLSKDLKPGDTVAFTIQAKGDGFPIVAMSKLK
jgi:Cu/Ag efflux protein CusF